MRWVAIDLFVGARTRGHKDLDVVMYWEDRDRIVEHMLLLGWMVFEPDGTGYLHRIVEVGSQWRVKDNIWCILPGNRRYRIMEYPDGMVAIAQYTVEQAELDFIEVLFNRRKDGCFLYARNHAIGRAMDKAILRRAGIAYLAPEIVLLYKSTGVKMWTISATSMWRLR